MMMIFRMQMRIDALQTLRSLLLAGAGNYEEMQNALRTLHVPFQVSLKDLRSQVVREACITVAYMSQHLGHRADRFLETLLQPIINLVSMQPLRIRNRPCRFF